MTTTQPTCGWIDNFGNICGKSASEEIVLFDRLVKGIVLVCAQHHATHNKTAAAVRIARRDTKAGSPSGQVRHHHSK